MARQSRSRPAARPAPAAASHTQSRGAATAAAPPSSQYASHPPPNAAHAPPVPPQAAQSSGPGMLAQMAATAGSVAVGSTIGHGISSMLFGGSSARASEEPSPQALNQQAVAQQPAQQGGLSCEFQAKEFTKCLETNDISACNWYLEQLKACQAAARPY